MVKRGWRVVCVMLGLAAMPALAQDSTSKTGCLPGDSVSPWATNEQCNTYIVDMDEFTSSWGTTYGIAPIIKTSKTGSGFSGSLMSAQGMSRLQRTGVEFAADSYSVWSAPGFGVNDDAEINDPGTLVDVAGTGNQFGVVFAEFATTDTAVSYNGVIGGLVNYFPAEPTRLYVKRVVAAVNGCDGNSNFSQLGAGSVDEDGFVHFRCDNFGATGCAGCACNTLANISGQNVFQVGMQARDCDVLNVISAGFPGGQFDAGATQWLVQGSATTYNTPGIISAQVTGSVPAFIGTNFAIQYARGTAFPVTADGTHLAAGVTDQRGNISYTSRNCSVLGSTHGIAAMIGKDAATFATIMNVFGLDASLDVTGAVALQLPATVTDNCDGTTNIPGLNEFDHYHSQVAFRGGNGQIALGVDQEGNLLAAAQAVHPVYAGNDWGVNYIAVARLNCTTDEVEWTMAGWNQQIVGKQILDGPGGTAIGQMVSLDQIPGAPLGPSVSAPMIDSVGNVYFLTAMERYSDGIFTVGLVRANYDPASFCYELELMFTTGDVFAGLNSGLDYEIDFLAISDGDSVNSGTAWSQNISETAHLNADPSTLEIISADTLGGMVISAEIVYDADQDGDFEQCADVPESGDQDYNVLLYIGATTPGQGKECPANLTIVGSTPVDGVVDARQPNDPSADLPRQGIGSATEPVTIDLGAGGAGNANCFALCETASDPLLGPNSITSVTDNGDGTYSLTLDHAITAGAVTTIQYTGDGSFVSFIAHPSNTNGDTAASPVDVLEIINNLNNVTPPVYPTYSEDIDHTGAFNPADLLRTIDLLNGAGVFQVWNGTLRPTNLTCP